MTHENQEHVQAKLVPLNATLEEEQELLQQQRVICGWKTHVVPSMCGQMRKGQRIIFWIALPSDEPVFVSMDGLESLTREEAKHRYCDEMPLLAPRELSSLDSPMVTSIASKAEARPNGSESRLLPIGHISIDADDFDTHPSEILYPPDGKTLSLTTLFILPCFRKYGLGTWTLHECERLIRSGAVVPATGQSTSQSSPSPSSLEDRKCSLITLSCLSGRHYFEDTPEGRAMWATAGRPNLPNKKRYLGSWYSSMGYEKYHEQPKYLLHGTHGEPLWWAEFWRKRV